MNAVIIPTNVKITFTVIPVVTNPLVDRKINAYDAKMAVRDVRSAVNRWYYLG